MPQSNASKLPRTWITPIAPQVGPELKKISDYQLLDPKEISS